MGFNSNGVLSRIPAEQRLNVFALVIYIPDPLGRFLDDLRRELVPGSLEVYPLQGYGAIEVGAHRFCHEENGKRDCGTMKFSMVWRKVGEEWKLSRVLSYAH